MCENVTKDSILNGAIKLWQPKCGYRVALDPLILSSFVNIKDNQKILDVGCGIGTISLILKYRNSSQNLYALDIDKFMCELCIKNAQENNLSIEVYNQSIETEFNKTFDCIVTNPPFYNKENFRISETKKFANFETVSLDTWLKFCIDHLNNKGTFYIIHIAERLDDILNVICKDLGGIEIIPIYSYADQRAKRVIVSGKKQNHQALKIMPPLIVHNNDGTFTNHINKILTI